MSLTTETKVEATNEPKAATGNVSKTTIVAAALKSGRRPTTEEILKISKTRVELLTILLNDFDIVRAKSDRLQKEQTEVLSREVALLAQRAKLGLFAGKEKKRIDEELATLLSKKNDLLKRIDQANQKTCFYATKADLERDIADEKAGALYFESLDKTALCNDDSIFNYDEALKVYLTDPGMTKSVNSMLRPTAFTNSVLFGRYQQEEAGEPELIEWQVLSRESNRILLISKYALDCQPYNPIPGSVTWETSYIRKWLNDSFLNNAFSADEQKIIQSTTVTADKNPSFKTDPGKATTDKLFLLSYKEANQYYSSDALRQCEGTPYCCAQKANNRFDQKTHINGCWWWLRSPGFNSMNAGLVIDGSISNVGDLAFLGNTAVRPALWLDFGF